MSPAERGVFIDQELSPEKVWGSEFALPTIIGRGSGRGFGVEGLHMPRGWESAGVKLRDPGYWEGFYRLLSRDCAQRNLKPGRLEVDETTGILTRVSVVHEGQEQSITLSDGIVTRERGTFDMKDVMDARCAVTLQASVCGFLNHVSEVAHLGHEYPYIDRGDKGGYFPMNLTLPAQVEEYMTEYPYGVITSEDYRERFALRASNVAGRFGHDIKYMKYDSRGVLTFVGVVDGSAQNFSLQSSFGQEEYVPHNVDTAEAALALFGITAMHITDLTSYLKKEFT